MIAFPIGALAEIVEHGRTGFLVNDADEMAGGDRSRRRRSTPRLPWVGRTRFSRTRMAAQYFALYAALAARAAVTTLAIDLITNEGARPAASRVGGAVALYAVGDAVSVACMAAAVVAAVRHRPPRIAVLHDGDRLSGMLPLYLLDHERRAQTAADRVRDHRLLDALLAPDAPADAPGGLLRVALSSAGAIGVTACELIDLPPDRPCANAPSGWLALGAIRPIHARC